jgi:C4-dicarboxylate transporter, DctQ subunit
MRIHIDRAYKLIMRVNGVLALGMGLIILVVDLLVAGDTIARYAFNSPTIWVFEITSYCLIYIVFLSAAYTLQEGGHVRVDFVLMNLPKKAQRPLLVLANLFALIYCIFLLWQSSRFTWMAIKGAWRSTTILSMPIQYIAFVMPLGVLLLCLTYLLQMWKSIWPLKPDVGGEK